MDEWKQYVRNGVIKVKEADFQMLLDEIARLKKELEEKND